MDEVSGRVCLLILESTLEKGGSEEELLAGLSLTANDLRQPRGRVGWEEFTTLLERCRDGLGGLEALDELGARHLGEPWPALARALAGGVSNAAGLYALAHWNGPAAFTCTRAGLKKLSDGRILQTIEIFPGFRDSPEFFYGMRGIIRATPRLLGQSDAVVEMQLGPCRASYVITPPPSRTWWARARRRVSRNAWFAGAVEELTFRDTILRESERQNRRTAGALAEKTRRLEREIEARKRTEQQLFQAQRLEALGILAGGIAHDFNNILTAIRGYAELAAGRAPADTPLRQDLDEIQIAGDRAAALIAQLLLFSRHQIQELRHIDVNQVITGIESLLRRLLGEANELEIRCAPDLPPVLADPSQIEQVIVNLVVNSRDALLGTGGGRVAIRTSASTVGTRAVVRIEVEDSGSGMSEETRTKIFEPFFTTKAPERGSGLGLSTVYGIVSQGGGRIDVRSKLGHGTTVLVELPASEGEVELTDDPKLETAATLGSETVLLVEDDAQVLEVARQILERHGYRVIACSSSLEALEQCQAGFERIDLLVADVVMPQMNGIELARRIRPLLPKLPSVWMSGYAQDDLQGSREPEGVFVRKPFTSETLLRAVRRALASNEEGGDKPEGEPA